jgi:ATP-binding cassette subfamily B protein
MSAPAVDGAQPRCILVFDRGEIVEQGTHAALTARTVGIYRSLFERQATEFAQISAAE